MSQPVALFFAYFKWRNGLAAFALIDLIVNEEVQKFHHAFLLIAMSLNVSDWTSCYTNHVHRLLFALAKKYYGNRKI